MMFNVIRKSRRNYLLSLVAFASASNILIKSSSFRERDAVGEKNSNIEESWHPFASLPSLLAFADSVSIPTFDSKGLKSSIRNKGTNDKSLDLVSVGMRRKNFYVAEVDVYMCGLYLSSEALGDIISSANNNLIKSILFPSKLSTEKRAAINLKFKRNVGTQTIVEAFNDAFVGISEDEVASFKKCLSNCIGLDGLKNDEEITFIWSSLKENGGLSICKNGDFKEVFYGKAIEERLLEVYIDTKRSISQELINSTNTMLSRLKDERKNETIKLQPQIERINSNKKNPVEQQINIPVEEKVEENSKAYLDTGAQIAIWWGIAVTATVYLLGGR